MDDLAFIDRLWEDWSPGYTDSADDREWVKESLRDPANLAAALGYYRATLQPELQVPELAEAEAACSGIPTQPHLYLHGIDDGCMGVDIAEKAENFLPVEGSRVELVPGHRPLPPPGGARGRQPDDRGLPGRLTGRPRS